MNPRGQVFLSIALSKYERPATAQLRPDSERLWGNMNPAQALAHCSAAIGMAEGNISPPRILIGRLLGPLAKKSLIVDGKPMRRNAMTEKSCGDG